MWIRIRTADGPSITLPVPLSMLRSRWLWQIIARHTGRREEQGQKLPAAADSGQIITAAGAREESFDPETARLAIVELTRYIRRHGHFTLVEVQSADGDHITITV